MAFLTFLSTSAFFLIPGVIFASGVVDALTEARIEDSKKHIAVWVFGLTFPVWGLAVGRFAALLVEAIASTVQTASPVQMVNVVIVTSAVGAVGAVGVVGSALSALLIRYVTASWIAARGALYAGVGWLFLCSALLVAAAWWNVGTLVAICLVGAICVWHYVVMKWLSRWARMRRLSNFNFCATCNYDLSGLPPSSPCPECGAPLTFIINDDPLDDNAAVAAPPIS